MASAQELASVRDRLFGLVHDDQIRQVAIPRPDPAIIASFLATEDISSLVSDAMDRLGIGGRLPASLIRPLASRQRCVGPAVTIRYGRHGGDVSGLRHRAERPGLAEREMYALGEPGDIGVFDCGGCEHGSVIGSVSARWARRFGIAGCIVDGAVRDVEGIQAEGIAVWSRSVTPASGNYRMSAIEVNGTVAVAGLLVRPGDLIVADGTGICVVPSQHVEAVAAVAREIQVSEQSVLDAIDAGVAPRDVPAVAI
ncbi:MAG: RraA family protein [Streptosporangiaceae bacterium]